MDTVEVHPGQVGVDLVVISGVVGRHARMCSFTPRAGIGVLLYQAGSSAIL
jgi:hypothetical protein